MSGVINVSCDTMILIHRIACHPIFSFGLLVLIRLDWNHERRPQLEYNYSSKKFGIPISPKGTGATTHPLTFKLKIFVKFSDHACRNASIKTWIVEPCWRCLPVCALVGSLCSTCLQPPIQTRNILWYDLKNSTRHRGIGSLIRGVMTNWEFIARYLYKHLNSLLI